jgi:hypothetical protein
VEGDRWGWDDAEREAFVRQNVERKRGPLFRGSNRNEQWYVDEHQNE